MVASAWLSLLVRNRFDVSASRIPFALLGAVDAIINSSLKLIQDIVFGKRIRACVLDAPPIFIIGHWRTGTTHLHELLTLDDQFAAPTTLECFAPAHWRATENCESASDSIPHYVVTVTVRTGMRAV